MPSAGNARLAILASGGGSNADKICAYFARHPHIQVCLIMTNRKEAGVLQVAARHHIDSIYVAKNKWSDPSAILPVLTSYGITHLVLAGFLLLVPHWLIQAYPGKIINIHPALLPRYGGAGMYGKHVHEAVKAAGETISGITIHEVNEFFDEGKILFQKEIELDPADTPEDIAAKVLRIEHEYFPRVIEQWVESSMLPA